MLKDMKFKFLILQMMKQVGKQYTLKQMVMVILMKLSLIQQKQDMSVLK